MTAQQSLKERRDLVNVFQNDPKTKRSIRPKIIIGTMKLMGNRINLTWAWQIIIVDPKYISYVEEQTEGRITRIGQTNCITAHFLVCYDVEIKRKIKRRHPKQTKMIKGTVQTEVEGGRVFRSSLANQV